MATPLNRPSQKKATPASGFVRVPLRDLLNASELLSPCSGCSGSDFLGLLGYRPLSSGAVGVRDWRRLTDSLDGTVARWFDIRTELVRFSIRSRTS